MNREAGIAALAGLGLAMQLMVLGAAFLVLRFVWRKFTEKNTQRKLKQLEVNTKEKIESLKEEKLYELAMDELDSGNVLKGIWAKSVAKSNGNDNQAKSKYLELRVKSLKDEAHIIQSTLESEQNTSGLIEVKKIKVPEPEKNEFNWETAGMVEVMIRGTIEFFKPLLVLGVIAAIISVVIDAFE